MAERNSYALKVTDIIYDKDRTALVMGCLHGALRSLLRVPAEWLMDVRVRTSSKFERATGERWGLLHGRGWGACMGRGCSSVEAEQLCRLAASS